MLLSTQGPFPPPALPGFSGTTDPSATLMARPAPRGVPVDVCRISPRASRVAAFFPFHACQRHYPDGSGSVPASLSSPSANGLPLITGGSASVSPCFEACSTFTRVPARMVAEPLQSGPLSPECFRPYRYLHDPPWLLPTGATVVGRDSHPPEEGAFPRRTVIHWGWRGAPAPSNPRPGGTPPCPPHHPRRSLLSLPGAWSLALTLAGTGRSPGTGLSAGNRSLGPSNAPSRPSGHAVARTGRSGHRPPRHGCGPHAPGPPRSPPGDDPTALESS